MTTDDPQTALRESIERLADLDADLRDKAFRSVVAYVQYIYAAATGGAGPVALPPTPTGTSATTGTFKCPKCGHNGITTFE